MKLTKLAKFRFHRHFCSFEVGKLDQRWNKTTFEQKFNEGDEGSQDKEFTPTFPECPDTILLFCDLLPFVNFVPVSKSSLPFGFHYALENLCQSSIKFDRLRSVPIIHRLLAIIFPVFRGVRVRRSSIEFDRVRLSLPFSFLCFRTFVISFHFHFPNSEIAKMITKTRKNESTKKCSLFSSRFRPRADAMHPQGKQRPARINRCGAIRYEFFPNFQRSIVVIRF